MPVGLGERDSMDCAVELTVPDPAEALAGMVRGPDGQGGGAVEAGEGVLGLKPADIGGLADDLGGGQASTTWDLEQSGCLGCDLFGDLDLEGIDLDGEGLAALE